MAKSYQELCTDGCVHFDDLLIFVYCDPEREKALTVRLRSMLDEPMDGDAGEVVVNQCEKFNGYLQHCINSWQMIMAKHRK